jgi:hypothetical protein
MILVALTGSMQPRDAAGAGGPMPFATEVTQLLNNVVLLQQYAEQVRMVVAQLQELQQWAQNLKQLSPTRVLQIIRDQFGITSIEELNQMLGVSYELASTLQMLQRDVTTITYEYDLAASTIQRLNRMGYQITPGDYATAMFALSHERSEHYGERIKRFKEAHQSAQRHLMRANALITEAPQIAGTVEGLAALNAGNAQMQVQLAQIGAMLATQGEIMAMEASRNEAMRMSEEQRARGAVDAIKRMIARGEEQ